MTFEKAKKNRLSRILNSPDKQITRTFGANGVLSRLFRQILLDLRIMGPRFGALMQDYILDARNGVPNNKKDQTSMRGNLTKEFAREQMTWKVFIKALRFLQAIKVVLVLEIHHRDGKKTLHSTEINLGGPNDFAAFEAQLDQPESQEHPGEHIPVLDHIKHVPFPASAVQSQPSASHMSFTQALQARMDAKPKLDAKWWYVWSPLTRVIYETIGEMDPTKYNHETMDRIKRQKVEKWMKTESSVGVARGSSISMLAGSYYNEESKNPTGGTEPNSDEPAKGKGQQ